MNATCSHCGTVFRVDPAKVPTGGVRARCSICRNVFRIEAGDDSPVAAVAPEARRASPEPGAAADPADVSAADGAGAAQETVQPSRQPDMREGEASSPPAAPPEVPGKPSAPAAAGGERPAASPFGSSDPLAKARRLARALVSDMVTYHPERRENALAAGTLKHEFREEIKKSWEEYVEQVGRETAMKTPYFREALNEILARGQTVF